MSRALVSPTPSTEASSLLAGGAEGIEVAEVLDEPLSDQARQSRDARERPVSTGRDDEVDGGRLAVIAEELGEAPEVEDLLVRQRSASD